jgi:transcriptional regulator with XRE-family HTH domain
MLCAVSRTFGENLKRARERRGVTQEDLARRVGFRRQSRVSTLENSSIVPRAETVVKFAKALDVEPRELLDAVETDYDRLRNGLPLHPAAVRVSRERPAARRKRAAR